MTSFFKKFNDANRGKLPFIIILAIIFILFFKRNTNHLSLFSISTVLNFLVIIISITFHEIGHAYAAYLSGDNTAKNRGRLSINPLKHIDPIGLLLPIFLIFSGSTFIIGWAKPVPVNYYNFRNGRLGEFLVSIAGVFINFFLAFIALLLFKFFRTELISLRIIDSVRILFSFNIAIGIFNLIPIPPLDGSKLIASFSPESLRNAIFSMDKYGFFIILFLVWSGILSKIIQPVFRIISSFYLQLL